MDPIADSRTIFKQLSDEFGGAPITGQHQIKDFFAALKERTRGLVIIDFLDLANWDCFEAFEAKENGILQLTWHDYRGKKESPEEREAREWVFPASLYSLALHVNSIVPISWDTGAVFLVNGFAKTGKEIRKLFSTGADDIKVFDNSFFEKRVVRKVGDQFEVCDFHCTPIFSIAIVPKASRISSHDSKSLLYLYNYSASLERLQRVATALNDSPSDHPDDIAEKINTVRRIFEFVLKVECCAAEVDIRKGYSQVLLGDLISLVKGGKDQPIQTLLGRFAEMANEFSHDSGKPVDLDKAKAVVALAIGYTALLQLEQKQVSRRP